MSSYLALGHINLYGYIYIAYRKAGGLEPYIDQNSTI